MPETSPTAEKVLSAAETVLRRHGVEKTNVVDIARTLGISHAAIYRHFPSKKALLDAVAARWLERITAPLETIAHDTSRTPTDRLVAWFDTLRKAKQQKVLDDPELFQVYHRLAKDAGELAGRHVEGLQRQLTRIISEGMAAGEFSARLDAAASALACLQAMAPFHHPALLLQQTTPPRQEEAHAIMGLLLAGLREGPAPLKA